MALTATQLKRKKEEEERARKAKISAEVTAKQRGGQSKGGLSSKDPAREELRQKQLRTDPLFAEQVRQADLKKQQSLQSQVSGETAAGQARKAEAITAITAGMGEAPKEQIEEAPTGTEKRQVFLEELAPSQLRGIPENMIQTDEEGRQFIIASGTAGEGGLSLFGTAVAGGIAGTAVAASGLSSAVSNFLAKSFTSGKVATSTTTVLQAPAKARAGASLLKISALSILGYSGLGSVKSVVSNVLTKKITGIEAEVTKVGEQLTKIPEGSSLGFSIDEDGNLYEYTQTMALQDIEEVEQSLIDAETALQTASIGQTILKITGKYNLAQAEIDKQKREIIVARGKVLNQIVNPSEALLNSRDFWRGTELLE